MNKKYVFFWFLLKQYLLILLLDLIVKRGLQTKDEDLLSISNMHLGYIFMQRSYFIIRGMNSRPSTGHLVNVRDSTSLHVFCENVTKFSLLILKKLIVLWLIIYPACMSYKYYKKLDQRKNPKWRVSQYIAFHLFIAPAGGL